MRAASRPAAHTAATADHARPRTRYGSGAPRHSRVVRSVAGSSWPPQSDQDCGGGVEAWGRAAAGAELPKCSRTPPALSLTDCVLRAGRYSSAFGSSFWRGRTSGACLPRPARRRVSSYLVRCETKWSYIGQPSPIPACHSSPRTWLPSSRVGHLLRLYTKNNQAAARAIKPVLGLDTLDFSALLAAPEPPVLSSALRARLGQHLAQLAHTQGRRLTAVERVLVEQSSERPPEPEVMYGGFSYHLQREELIVVSWMRMVGGSGQRHVITEHGARLVDEGFV